MVVGLDTSILLRLLTGEPPALAQKVLERFQGGLDRGDSYFVNDIVVAETYYALQHHYDKTKEEAIGRLKALAADPSFAFSDGFKRALSMPALHRANPGFVDRLLSADYEGRGYPTLSCEKSFRRLANAEVVTE